MYDEARTLSRPDGSAASHWQLPELVTAADPGASVSERNLWLVRTGRWLMHDMPTVNEHGTPYAVLRLRHLLNLMERQPELRMKVRAILLRAWHEGDAAGLFADVGLPRREGLMGALWRRSVLRWLPPSADTPSLTTVFDMMLAPGHSLDWLRALDADSLARFAALFDAGENLVVGNVPSLAPWQGPLRQALRWLTIAVEAAWSAPELRHCVGDQAAAARTFALLGNAQRGWDQTFDDGQDAHQLQQVNLLREALSACQVAADDAREFQRVNGLSTALLYELRLIQDRLTRMESLLNVLLSPNPARDMVDLLVHLAHAQANQRSVMGVLREHHRLLARKMAERHAISGEHYVARDAAEYRSLLRRAAGGGVVVAGTTLSKFAIGALGLAPFWTGVAAGSAYAASFVLIMLLHFSLATKQPALTAATLTDRLGDMQARRARGDVLAVEAMVDEIVVLLRSQMVSVMGNLGAVIPAMAALQALAWWLAGQPLIEVATAQKIVRDLSILGLTPLYAAFTGVLLFAASLAGGWFENAFAYHRLHSALATHPDIVARWGAARAQRWAQWWRANINGLSSNVVLGLMLGLAPPLAAFLGLPLDVRHVTLSTGQLTAAVGTLGWSVMTTPAFWACVTGIAAIGLLNLGVSFTMALRMTMRARGVDVGDKRALWRALGKRLRTRPMSFLFQPADPGT